MGLDEKSSKDMGRVLRRIEDKMEITEKTTEAKHKDVEDL